MCLACESIEVSRCKLVGARRFRTNSTYFVRILTRLCPIGPALLAFTLMCCAYSLRTWRRNGVACDELLFLPGTPHGLNQGIESPLVVEMPETPSHHTNEGDAAAGIGIHRSQTDELAPIMDHQETSLLQASSRRILNKSQSAPIPMQSLEEPGEEGHAEEKEDDFDSWNGEDEESDEESPPENDTGRIDMVGSLSRET